MEFLDRSDEMERLQKVIGRREGSLVVVYGRRRVGKTRLLLEWARRHDGIYFVADQSTAQVQRAYFARSVARVLPGFADVHYPDWRALFSRLSQELPAARRRRPIIIDELPYLVQAAPELPSVLQQWVDHEVVPRGMCLALAGSSQRMMQGLVLASAAPLYGRAHVLLKLSPLPVHCLPAALKTASARDLVRHYAAWGGVPRYWELARAESGSVEQRVERLVLDPLGPLHREPDLLLLEELPPAIELRPILDAVGNGAHRVSEISGRVGYPATSLSRPLSRLAEMELLRREVPFGESEKRSRRSLYRIADPFLRLWFRVVAPHQSALASSMPKARGQLLEAAWPGLVAGAWEELSRTLLPLSPGVVGEGNLAWGAAGRWWHGSAPEWDLVCETLDHEVLLLGETKWHDRPFTRSQVEPLAARLRDKPAPSLSPRPNRRELRALFLPEVTRDVPPRVGDVVIVTLDQLLDQP